jgi:hypothetical protein
MEESHMKRNYVYIGAACLLCLALVAVVPAAATGGWESAGGQQENCPSECTENPQAQFCHGSGTGACQYGADAGNGTCDRTCDPLQSQTRDRIRDRTCLG